MAKQKDDAFGWIDIRKPPAEVAAEREARDMAVARFIATRGVTKCPPGFAAPSQACE